MMPSKQLRDAPLARLLAAMAVGALVGAFAPACVIRALNSFGSTFAQFIKFIVPFIIVGLVTPAIAEAGRSAGRMLLATIAIAYASTILSGAFAFSVADAVLPRIVSGLLAASGAAKAFPAFFTLKIPPVMDVVTAIAVAFVFGLAMATVECPALTRAFGEIKRVISLAIAKAVVPLLIASLIVLLIITYIPGISTIFTS